MSILNWAKILLASLLKKGLAFIVVLVMLTTPAIAAEKETAEVTVAPAAQKKIQEANPDERKQLEAAISAGNKFIPYHFDGRAYDVGDSGIEDELKFWLKNVRPLINKDVKDDREPYPFEESAYDTELFPPLTRDLTIEGHPDWPIGNTVSVCPKIELVAITATDHPDSSWKNWYPKSFANDNLVLEYRAKIIGALMDARGAKPRFFLSNKNDAFETALISLDKNNKVSRVASQNARWTWTAERQIGLLTLFISGALSNGITADDKVKLNIAS